jgi:hypothetical protein
MSLYATRHTEHNASYRDICWPLRGSRVRGANREMESGPIWGTASPRCVQSMSVPSVSATVSAVDDWDRATLAGLLEAGIGEIETIYEMRDVPSVRQYLRNHPELIQVLLEAHPYLKEIFGTQVRVFLEIVTDPEAAREQELFAYIVTTLSADEAVRRLDDFDDGWFLQHVERVAGRLNFNLEFV